MATTKRRELFKMVAQRADRHYKLSTVTTAGQGGIEDTALKAEADADDGIVSVWVTMLETGDNAAPEGEITRALSSNAYTASSGVLLVEPDFTASTAQGESYMLTEISPHQIGYEIDRAIRTLFPSLYLPIRDESIVVDNLLVDRNFEASVINASSTGAWDDVGQFTIAYDTTIFFQGTQSAKCTDTGSGGDGFMVQDILDAGGSPKQNAGLRIGDVMGRTITFKAWVFGGGETNAYRLGVDFDNTYFSTEATVVWGDYHSGFYQWEELSVEATIPDSASTVVINAVVQGNDLAASDVFYVDNARLHISGITVTRYAIPETIELGPHSVSQQYDAANPNGAYHRIGGRNQLIEGRTLRLEGMGRLTVPSTMNATVEVDETRAELIATAAAIRLVDPDDRDRKGDLIDEHNSLIGRPGIMMTSMSAQTLDTFHYESDSDGRYIVFDRVR
jgi:hypothetical protein